MKKKLGMSGKKEEEAIQIQEQAEKTYEDAKETLAAAEQELEEAVEAVEEEEKKEEVKENIEEIKEDIRGEPDKTPADCILDDAVGVIDQAEEGGAEEVFEGGGEGGEADDGGEPADVGGDEDIWPRKRLLEKISRAGDLGGVDGFKFRTIVHKFGSYLVFDESPEKQLVDLFAIRNLDVVANGDLFSCARNDAWHAVAGDSNVHVGKELIQTVGGSKLEYIKGENTLIIESDSSRLIDGVSKLLVTGDSDSTIEGNSVAAIDGASSLSVGGDSLHTIEGDAVQEVKKSSTLEVTKEYGVKAKSITIEANTEITLKVGASTLTISASGITIKAPKVDVKGNAMLTLDGGVVMIG